MIIVGRLYFIYGNYGSLFRICIIRSENEIIEIFFGGYFGINK